MRIGNNKYFPRDTRELLPREIKNEDFNNFNFYFLFNTPDVSERSGKKNIRLNTEIDRFFWNKDFLHQIDERRKFFCNHLNLSCTSFKAELSWRMVIGLGAYHPQETSMTLHHIYGIPYIPGSAVKGVTRHWVIWKDFGGEEENALKNQDFINIFGTQSQQGKVIFFDAYPIDEIRLKIDVMTPHYPEYYSGEKAPTDWQSPKPIKFLTVEKTKFRFHLASKKENESLLQKASSWLKDALTHFGIGAKTAIGYGYFSFNYGG